MTPSQSLAPSPDGVHPGGGTFERLSSTTSSVTWSRVEDDPGVDSASALGTEGGAAVESTASGPMVQGRPLTIWRVSLTGPTPHHGAHELLVRPDPGWVRGCLEATAVRMRRPERATD